MPTRVHPCNLLTEGYSRNSGHFHRYCGVCTFLHASAVMLPQSGGLGVPSSNLGAPTSKINNLTYISLSIYWQSYARDIKASSPARGESRLWSTVPPNPSGERKSMAKWYTPMP